MTTKPKAQLVGDITRLAMQISIQGKYHVFVRYSGHINHLDVEVHPGDCDYASSSPAFTDGFGSMENWIPLAAHVDDWLFVLHEKLSKLLDVDADRVPV